MATSWNKKKIQKKRYDRENYPSKILNEIKPLNISLREMRKQGKAKLLSKCPKCGNYMLTTNLMKYGQCYTCNRKRVYRLRRRN